MRPMKNNFKDLTDDELGINLINSLDYMGREISAQLIICLFLLIYNVLGWAEILSVNFFWYLIQVICWCLYLFHRYRYNKKDKVFNLYKEEMVKREIL